LSEPSEISELDLERDLPTTSADVEALRAARRVLPPGDLTQLDRLWPPLPIPFMSQRKIFPEQPPFEL